MAKKTDDDIIAEVDAAIEEADAEETPKKSKKSAKKGEETAKKKSTYKNTAAKLESCKKRMLTLKAKIVELCKKMEVEKARLAQLQNKANRKERMDFMKGVTDEQLEAFKAFLAQQKQKQTQE